jgi:hypothetical protein
MNWFSAIQTLLIVHLIFFSLLIFWSEHLLLIPRFGNQNSFVIKASNYSDVSMIWCLCNLFSSGWVPILTSALGWIMKSIVGLLSDSVLHIQSPCEFFPWYLMSSVNCILCLANHALLSSLFYVLLKFVVYVPKMPLWVEPMPSLNRVNPKVFMSHTLLVFCQIKFQHYNLSKARSEWNVMH